MEVLTVAETLQEVCDAFGDFEDLLLEDHASGVSHLHKREWM